MGSLKKFAVAGALLVLMPSAAALAADLTYYPPPETPPPVSGWYLRGDIGMTNQSVGSLYNVLYSGATVTNIDKGFDSSPLFSIGIGKQINQSFRIDFTGEYRGGASFHGLDVYSPEPSSATGMGSDDYSGTKSELTFLANAYVDLGNFNGIVPFLGAGIGASRNTISDFRDVNVPTLGVAYGDKASKWNFAWALYAGLGYEINQRLTLEAAYRYIDLGSAESGDLTTYTGVSNVVNPMVFNHLTSQDLKVGFRYKLN